MCRSSLMISTQYARIDLDKWCAAASEKTRNHSLLSFVEVAGGPRKRRTQLPPSTTACHHHRRALEFSISIYNDRFALSRNQKKMGTFLTPTQFSLFFFRFFISSDLGSVSVKLLRKAKSDSHVLDCSGCVEKTHCEAICAVCRGERECHFMFKT